MHDNKELRSARVLHSVSRPQDESQINADIISDTKARNISLFIFHDIAAGLFPSTGLLIKVQNQDSIL